RLHRHPLSCARDSFAESFSCAAALHPLSSILFPYTTLFRSTIPLIERFYHTPKTSTSESCSLFCHNLYLLLKNYIRQVSLVDVLDRKSTRLNSSHVSISSAVFCLKQKSAIRDWRDERVRSCT